MAVGEEAKGCYHLAEAGCSDKDYWDDLSGPIKDPEAAEQRLAEVSGDGADACPHATINALCNAIGDSRIQFWVCDNCPGGRVEWDGARAVCLECGATNDEEDTDDE